MRVRCQEDSADTVDAPTNENQSYSSRIIGESAGLKFELSRRVVSKFYRCLCDNLALSSGHCNLATVKYFLGITYIDCIRIVIVIDTIGSLSVCFDDEAVHLDFSSCSWFGHNRFPWCTRKKSREIPCF